MTAARKTAGRASATSDSHVVSTDATTAAAAGPGAPGGAGAAADRSVPPRAGARTRGRPKTRPDGAFPAYRYASTDSLIPYVNNARTHSPAQIAKIAASIKEFGFTNPVLTDGKRGIIAGHGRVLAAQKLRMAQVPIIELSHLTPAQRRAYIIADNRLALDAGWDEALLADELEALSEDGFNLALTGFDPSEISRLLGGGTEGLTDPDDVPETPGEPVTVRGDVWLLGRHRLVCGDSTTTEAVDAALAGVKPHLMVTDPPYGVEYDPEWRATAGVNKNRGKMGLVENDDPADWSEAWTLFQGDVAYVWCASMLNDVAIASLEATGLKRRSHIIWSKDRFTLGRGHYHWQHEPCWYVVRGTGHWFGDRSQTTIWNIKARDDSGHGHSTQKPVECMKRPIENNSSIGQAVYEPFSGSGTTIIAAEMTGRICHAIELSPFYVDVAVLRWQAFTGQQATLESTGRSFAETQAERLKVEVGA